MQNSIVNTPCDGISSVIDEKLNRFIVAIPQMTQGGRNNGLHQNGRLLRKKFGLMDDALRTKLSEINQAKCTPPLSEGEVTTIARSINKANTGDAAKRSSAKAPKSKKKHRTEYFVSTKPEPVDAKEIRSKEVSVYQHCRTNAPVCTLTIGKILRAFRTGRNSKELIDSIRTEPDKDKRGELKKQLHAVVFGSEPQAERKAALCKPNGVLCLDFDNIPMEELEAAREAIAMVPYVFAVALSVSGTGLFALAVYEGSPDLKNLLAAMQANFSYMLDKACSDLCRLRIVTQDESLITKEQVYPAILHERTEPALPGPMDDVPENIGIDVLDLFLQQIEEISFPESESGKIGHNGYYIGSIDHLLKTAKLNHWDIGIRNEAPHFYIGESWQRVDQQSFRHLLQAVGMKQGIPHRVIKDHLFVEKLVKQFASEARFPVLSVGDLPKINLRNGTLHFTPNGTKLNPFDKHDGLCYQLGYDYDESATAPLFKQFLDRVLPDVAVQKLVFQYIGYVFLRNLNLEKILFLYGSGANGKSVFLNVVRGLFGAEQCCEYSLEGITGAEYQRAELGNYLLNVSTEISTRMGTDTFKKIASREPLQARYPYGKPFIVKDYATSIFAMNELPRDVEQTSAFYRRFLIIPFEVTIPSDEQDPDLAKKIIGSEMSGVLNYVIEGIKSLLAERKFDIPESVQRAIEKFRQESDSVLSFLNGGGWCISTEQWIPLQDLYNFYKQQCKDDGRVAVSKTKFKQRLLNLGYTVAKKGHSKTVVVYAEREEEVVDEFDDDQVPY